MDGKHTILASFLEGANKRFVVPVYQRNYDWERKNWEQLYQDLIKAVDIPGYQPFIGSIVFIGNQLAVRTPFIIIDGQQRLTTISLILLAIYHLIKNGVIEGNNQKLAILARSIYEKYLWDPYNEEIKLILKKGDKEDYDSLFHQDRAHEFSNEKIRRAYQFFYSRIGNDNVDVNELVAAIESLILISISLELPHDDPQLIFESLNSTGLALTEADKVRNFVLMDMNAQEQEQLYAAYWERMENQINSDDLTDLISTYLTIKNCKIPKKKNIYFEFKDYVNNYIYEHQGDKKTLLNELLQYATRYAEINRYKNDNTNPFGIHGCIFRLMKLDYSVVIPLLLELLSSRDNNKISANDVERIFNILESYLFRRMVCGLESFDLKRIFLSLIREITSRDYIEVDDISNILLGNDKNDSFRFPDDDEFKEAFEQKNFYQMKLPRVQYTLERLEQPDNNDEHVANVWAGFERSYDGIQFTVEHIMPQKLNNEWIEDLGENYEEIYNKWVDKIANLTITAYNPEYGNRRFEFKKNICEHALKYSPLRLNQWITNNTPNDKWGEKELEERSEDLVARALEIWQRPKLQTVTLPEYEIISLDIENSQYLNGRSLRAFSYKNQQYDVNRWIDMYVTVLKILHEEHPAKLIELCQRTHGNHGIRMIPDENMQEDANTKLIDAEKHIYASAQTNTSTKIENLKWFFNLYDADPADLNFYLEKQDENE